MIGSVIRFAFYAVCITILVLTFIAWGLGYESLGEFLTGVSHAQV